MTYKYLTKEGYSKVKKAIENGKAKDLKELSADQLQEYKYYPSGKKGMDFDILAHACLKGSYKVIKTITKSIRKYFDTYDDFGAGPIKDNYMYQNPATLALLRSDTKAVNLLKKELDLKTIEIDLKDAKDRNIFITKVSKPINGTRKGSLSVYDKGGKVRPPRSYAGDRERQLLKQMSTILFYAMKAKSVADMVEIQVMHLEFGDKNFLFIAGNKSSLTAKFIKYFPDANKLKKRLCKDLKVKRSTEGDKRMTRYTKNFRDRIYGEIAAYNGADENDDDIERYQKIRALLRDADGNFNALTLEYKKQQLTKQSRQRINTILTGNCGIFFVDTSTCKGAFTARHAEEILVDIKEVAAKIAIKQKVAIYTCIGGKMRPCVTCFGRMKANGIDNHGKFASALFKHPTKSLDDKSFHQSAEALLANSGHVTKTASGRKDTAHDSETDEDSDNDDHAKAPGKGSHN